MNYDGFGGAKMQQDAWSPSLEAQDEGMQLTKPKKIKRSAALGCCDLSGEDMLAMLGIELVTLLVFAAIYVSMSYYWHYKFPALDWAAVFIVFFIVCFLAYLCVRRMRQIADGVSDHFAVWAAALCIGLVLAFFGGLIFGHRNYAQHMEPYYQWKELNSYKGVDPSTAGGRAFMDAGTITFKEGSHLDFGKSSGFKNFDMYCVAPIISKDAPSTSYDFWAIGINCCTGSAQDFACGRASHTEGSTGGLRLLNDAQLPFYKMAVTQASTTYGIKAEHPIFVYWVQDVNKSLASSEPSSWGDFGWACLIFAVVQAVILLTCSFPVYIMKSRMKA